MEEVREELPKQEKSAAPVSDEVMLWDKRRDELRKLWEEEEIRLTKKNSIHYQDVLFNGKKCSYLELHRSSFNLLILI